MSACVRYPLWTRTTTRRCFVIEAIYLQPTLRSNGITHCGSKEFMNLLIDNNDGLGPQDYTARLDADRLPQIGRKLNAAATLCAWLVSADASFRPPCSGGRVILQRSDGFRLFTGYLDVPPQMEYLGSGQTAAWRY